ncbi:hypothetical protein J4427_01550 [Candidatus Woesearchaeota archaeon]|nr:hypothetical protein [Candidatus Woesearchaeota archaeon]
MDKYKKRFVIFVIVIIILYLFLTFFGTKTGNFVVQTSMSLANSMIPQLIQNIPDQSFDEDANLTLNMTYYFNETDDINFSATAVQNITILIYNDTNLTIFIPDSNFHGAT